MDCVGRFAPTPSGRLHLGSLIACLGAYLRARHEGGACLLRIEDLDTPRCCPETTPLILSELKELGFAFDGEVKIQSQNTAPYEKAIEALKNSGEAFYCGCTRQSLKKEPCRCYEKALPPKENCSLRFKPKLPLETAFYDELRGRVDFKDPYGFLTLKRSDGIISYNLACVVDDHEAGVSEIVRGVDLMYVTARQNALIKALGYQIPRYIHLPLLLEREGLKLSKQNHAVPALERGTPSELLLFAFHFLGQDLTGLSAAMSPSELLLKAAARFDLKKIPAEDRTDYFDAFRQSLPGG